MMAGGALPPMQPGQMNPVAQPVSNAPTSQPQVAPGVPVAGALPPGVQLIMQGQQAAAMQGMSV